MKPPPADPMLMSHVTRDRGSHAMFTRNEIATVSGIESFGIAAALGYASSMTREEFVAKCAKRSETTVESVLEFHEISPCDCGKKKCPGWKATYKFRNRRRRG